MIVLVGRSPWEGMMHMLREPDLLELAMLALTITAGLVAIAVWFFVVF
jgi:hypothetical protein